MPQQRLTDKGVKALRAEDKQVDYWDTATPGLGIRVGTSGKKTFFYRYRASGKQRRMKLGCYPALSLSDARRKMLHLQLRTGEGQDPQGTKHEAQLAETVGDLFEVYFKDKRDRITPSSMKKYRGMYRRQFEKPLSTIKASELRKANVIPILRELGKRAPTQCERCAQLIQACLNHAVGLDLIDFNPLHKLPRFGYTRIGERFLSPEEVVTYLEKIEEFPLVEQSYFRLLLFYGTRPGELAKWQWEWIGNDRIVIPGEFQKNRRSLVLPITPKAQEVFDDLRFASGHTLWLFPNPDETGPRASFGKNKDRLVEKMNLKVHWTLRDLRRTTETLLRELRIRPEVVAVILNHNTSQLRKIYDKSASLSEKRKALLRYEKYLERLKTEGVKDKVVELVEYRAG